MNIRLQNNVPRPSRKTIAFLRLFARNYRELETADGEFARMMLK